MNKIYSFLVAILLTNVVWAQVPQKMSYQAVVRDAANALKINQKVGIQISLLQGSVSGDAVYVETQAPTTNDNGLLSIEIGAGTVISGSLTTIDWSKGPYFIHTETDPTGGTNYTITGTSQLLSVPYALHAQTAESITGEITVTETDPLFIASVASSITATDTAKWSRSTPETGAQLDSAGIASMGYVAGPRADLTKLAPLASPTFTGTVSGIDKTMVGLTDVENTSDADKGISTAAQVALDLKESAANKSTDGTLATNSDDLFPTEKAVKTYVDAIAASGVADASATAAGKIQLAGDLAGTATAPTVPGLALKAPLADPTFTGTVSGIDKTMVGLTNVNNTSDAKKPVSTATQTALDLKAPLKDPTFTGTVSGIDKTMVGLTNVNNTSDAKKPVSTATQTALDLKAPLKDPTFKGTATATTFSGDINGTINTATTATTQSSGDNSTKVATTAFVTASVLKPGTATGQITYWNGTAWVVVAPGTSLPGNQAQTLVFCNGVPTWGTCPAVVPTLSSTTSISSIKPTTASSGGVISNDGGASVTARGVVWGPSKGPTISGSKTSNGTGTGTFTSSLTSLTPGKTYYVRAYATNSAGTAYGAEVSFKTVAVVPTLSSTTSISSITATTASSGGVISNDGGASVTARGVVWGTSKGPTISGSKTSNGTGTGTFTSSLTSLTPGKTYYVRAYATNSAGTAYGAEVSFKTVAVVPTLSSTTSISSITATTASSGGVISNDGGASVTARGVVWGTSKGPTISGSKTSNGTGTGTFTSSLTNLTSETTYYARAYATNSVGTAYGAEVSFRTTATVVPTLSSTTSISSIAEFSASSGGTISNDGGASVTARGVVWGPSKGPTISGSKTSNGTGTGTFTSSLTNLTSETTYYARAYATNSVGTAYGAEVSFRTTAISVGTKYKGGIVAYILKSGDPGYVSGEFHGLIAAVNDESSDRSWRTKIVFVGATGTELGKGLGNTNKIISTHGGTAGSYIYAAGICADYSVTEGGVKYDDWYLPSKDELNKMYLNKGKIGGFSGYYWSSTGYGREDAWLQSFINGVQASNSGSFSLRVRAVRSF